MDLLSKSMNVFERAIAKFVVGTLRRCASITRLTVVITEYFAMDATRQSDISVTTLNGHEEPQNILNAREQELAILFRRMLELIGEDPSREGLLKTPERMAKAYARDLFAGYNQDPSDFMTTFEGEGYNELVLVKDITVSSMCEHHCLPFIGTAHVGYIPSDRIIGLSKIPRLVNMYAARMQVQERLTMQIADAMEEHLKPLGVMVVIDAVHTCMCMRGVKADGASTVTSAVKGVFLDDTKNSKSEFLRLIGK